MLGIYIHIPFCRSKCAYCDFFSVARARGDVPHEAYAQAIVAQLDCDASAFEEGPVGSIYFGGGTPSLMQPAFFARVIGAIEERFDCASDCEVSTEANPGSIDAEWCTRVCDAGVNRLSIGVQSFQPELLKTLGRVHSSDEAMTAIAVAQDAGFQSVSIDLMFGIPGQGMAQLEEDLRTAMTFPVEHLSVYQLTIEEGTPLWASQASQASQGLDEEEMLQQMRTVARMLGRGGWERYEISNFAKPGCACRHNLNYWRYGQYLGLGAGATSMVRWYRRTDEPSNHRTVFGRRFTQVRDIESYMRDEGALAESEAIDARTAMGEFCFLGLRMHEGISPAAFEACFGVRFETVFGQLSAELVRHDLLEECGDRLRLTTRGLEISNQVFARFVS